jgi:hypothetical protein
MTIEAKDSPAFDITSIATGKSMQAEVPFNDKVTVIVKHISRERISTLLKQSTKITFDNRHQKIEDVDNIKFGELLGVEAIAGWTGLESEGATFPCTDENKRLLMRKWTDFAKFISDICTDLEALLDAEKEAVRKN